MLLASPSPIYHAELPRNITDLSTVVLFLATALLVVWFSVRGGEQSLLVTAQASLAVPVVLLSSIIAHLAAEGQYSRRIPFGGEGLRLEMSLVGPRPIVEAEVPRSEVGIAYYYQACPGLTGLWQISDSTEISYAQRVRLDSWCVKNWTLRHDLVILLRMVPTVLKSRGAY